MLLVCFCLHVVSMKLMPSIELGAKMGWSSNLESTPRHTFISDHEFFLGVLVKGQRRRKKWPLRTLRFYMRVVQKGDASI